MAKLNKTPINFRYNDRTVTSDTTLNEDDNFVYVDASGGNITITLPPVSAGIIAGQVIHIKRIDDSANTVTIDGDGAEVIDGQSTQTIASQYTSIMLHSNGTEWFIH